MDSKIAQKLIAVGLILSLCFLVACGKGGSSSASSEDEKGNGSVITGPKACYGDNCAKLKSINGTSEGYLNPYTDSSFMQNANKDQYRVPVQAVDLNGTSPNLKISKNFILSEMMSLEKGNYGIFSPAIVKILQQLRDKVGSSVKINSAYRSPKWNSGIDGSAKWSRHQYGDAVDIKSAGASLDQLVQYCRELGATYIDKYVAHVHCDWRNKAVDPIFFGAVRSNDIHVAEFKGRAHILNELAEKSKIHVSGAVRAGKIVKLHSSVSYKEDTEELYKKWEITAPNGDVRVYEQSEVSLPLVAGTYKVVHTIGENIHLSMNLFVQ